MTFSESDQNSLQLQLPDQAATERLAHALAGRAAAGDVIALRGDLGAGKTTFARAYINALAPGQAEEVPSPTFTLVQLYQRAPAPVWHFDLYRLEDPEEAFELGIEEALAVDICLIEWPERLGALLPDDRLDLELRFAERDQARSAVLTGGSSWRARLAALANPQVPA
ncbi:MAG: tRNA (adenosine(37)-N6)-threonylcarbamoyltransferase complex ATPase subunit type 1 TsaE [Pseudomonadota bacterium]